MLHMPTDADLIVRAKAADPQAITMIYERYAPAIYNYLKYRVHDTELAEDLCADVFVRMLAGLDRYEDRGWPLSAWLYRIAHDRMVDALRRQQTQIQAQIPLEQMVGSSTGFEDLVATSCDIDLMQQTLQELTKNQCAVLQMRFIHEMSVQEVAHALGRTESAVKALQHRALNSMARHLSNRA